MGVWISLLLWLVISGLLLFGWFYNMGQYRETTKDMFVTCGTCVAALWALRTYHPGLTLTVTLAAVVVAFMLFSFLSKNALKIPKYVDSAAAILFMALLMYVCDKFLGMSFMASCIVGAVGFCVLYGLIIYLYARLPKEDDNE